MSTRVRIILAAAVVLIIAAAAAVALWSNNRPYETLFTDLTTDCLLYTSPSPRD